MPSIETKIWLALKGRIDTLMPTTPKAWPGELFDQVHQTYLRIGRVSASPENVMIDYGKGHVRRGSIIITLVAPLADKQTTTRLTELAGSIANHFEDGSQMRYHDVCVTVTDYPAVQQGYEDEGYWSIPVNIPWRTYA